MVRNRGRSTALKMALAGMCTALCIEGMFQRGFSVSVYAEDTEDENYTDSQEWQDFKTYWVEQTDNQINNFVATQSPELQAQYLTYILAGNMAIANMEYQENALAMRADPNTGAIDYSVDIPAGSISTGWYYRGSVPHSVSFFAYGVNGDPVIAHGNIPIVSADDFSISLIVQYDSSLEYPTFITNTDQGWRWNYTTQDSRFTFQGAICTGIFEDASFPNRQQAVIRTTDTSTRFIYLDDSSYTGKTFVNYVLPSSYMGGDLKDANGSPISNARQQFIRAQVGNNFPDFLLDLKQQLDDNFPEEVVNELWYDPTQGESLPDVGTLDSLTFPPGLPSVSFNDVELPSEPLPAKMLSGAGFWFTSFTNMIDALGVKYIVITFLIIALIMAILKI